jgi:hypothetical protein
MIFVGWVFFILLNSIASAEGLGTGLVNISGQYANQLGAVGSVTNRATASSLYQQAMADAAQAKATMNIGLGVQAYKEYQNAIHADDQSHSFATSALNGVNSGSNAGQFDMSKFSSLGVNDLNDLVTSSSPYYSQARSQAQSYGLQMSEDRQYMKTPFGAFPTNMTDDEMIAIGSQIAAKYGIPPSVLAAGLQAGQSSSEDIASKIAAKVQQLSNSATATATATVSDSVSATESQTANSTVAGTGAGANAVAVAVAAVKTDRDWDQVARNLASFREKLMKESGQEPIGTRDQDIFQMIHSRYVAHFQY